jgi:drug/metabolite transporter (DMT)-like permease
MLLVLFGALLHASWNVLVKSGGDALIDTTIVLLGGSVLAMIALPFLPEPAQASWPFIAASSVLQVGYFALLGTAYRSGEVSLAYPLMRGTAPLLVALASWFALGEQLSGATIMGVMVICAGILTMPLSKRDSRGDWRTVGFAMANGGVIAAYTLVDGVGSRRSGAALSYTLAIFLTSSALFVPWIAWHHGASLVTAVRRRWHLGLGGGACIILSYALALWAMTRAPIASVAALRETSILFSLVLARFVLQERPSLVRVAAGLLILAGAGTLRLG